MGCEWRIACGILLQPIKFTVFVTEFILLRLTYEKRQPLLYEHGPANQILRGLHLKAGGK